MKISIPENIGDEVILDDSSIGKIIAIHITGPNKSVSYEIGWWSENTYKITNFWRFEFKLSSNNERKVGY
ncbi:hypothetical protein LCGC14_2405460 [marine sediment metagenome]|uniref:Uncharacterized protein n=1 Tax=marine sediment metagenome TaxID=412755 RepID=A0A0F9BU12_9ZZZZ